MFNNDMDDLFNQLMGNMNGFNSEQRRYLINGREVTPAEFMQYRQTGKLPSQNQQSATPAGQLKQDGILAKLGRNLTQEARDGKLDPVIGRNQE
ncbi:MAG: ATP-dependent Clp protease ATP-binding subunit, partial [Limosilactobacillus sp.]|nr:ATP-dependent Clp protease ATP-binding subunit [Limosilactobacillus sp.]